MILIYKFVNATLVCGNGVFCRGYRSAHNDVIGTDLLCLGRGHNTLLFADIAIGEAYAGGYGYKILTAQIVHLARFQRLANNAVKTAVLCVLRIVHYNLIDGFFY